MQLLLNLSQGRRAGRSRSGRGLASDLQGMQAQLADLDAMWSVVNAAKLEHTAGSRVCHQHFLTVHSTRLCLKPTVTSAACGHQGVLDS